MKKLKLKKKIKRTLILLIILIIGIAIGIDKYKEYKYKQTNEYKLTLAGYTIEESKFIIDNLNDKNETYFINNTKNNYLIDLIKEKYFIEKNLYEYIEYRNNNKSKELNDVVALVNVGANKDWYDIKSIKETQITQE